MDAQHIHQRCPKCGGNMFLYDDYDGWYEQCLQCSFLLYLDVVYEDRGAVDSNKTLEISQSTSSSK
jgi:ribosomal protein S27AE